MLNQKLGNKVVPEPLLPRADPHGQFITGPLKILDRDIIKRSSNQVVPHILVQQYNTKPAYANWEDCTTLV